MATKLKKTQQPSWLFRYHRHRENLLSICDHLVNLPNQTVHDDVAGELHLEFRPLEYMTGNTLTDPAASSTPFFMPTHEPVLRGTQHQSVKHTINFPEREGIPADPMTEPTAQDLVLGDNLADEIQNCIILADRYLRPWEMTPIG